MTTVVSTPFFAQNAITGFAMAGADALAIRNCGSSVPAHGFAPFAVGAAALVWVVGALTRSDPQAATMASAASIASEAGAREQRDVIVMGESVLKAGTEAREYRSRDQHTLVYRHRQPNRFLSCRDNGICRAGLRERASCTVSH